MEKIVCHERNANEKWKNRRITNVMLAKNEKSGISNF